MPNIFAECLLAALRFAALWAIFNLLHRPRTRLRLILASCLMFLQFPFCRILFFASGGNFALAATCDTILFLILAFICEGDLTLSKSNTNFVHDEPTSKTKTTDKSSLFEGDLIRPVISAMYFNVMLQMVNYIGSCYFFAFAGSIPPSFSFWSYFWKTVEGTLILLWTLFYYKVSRSMTAKAPVSFSLLTILTPLAGLAIIAASTTATRSLLEHGVNVFLYGALFGTLIIVLNMCVYYLYIKLSVAHESLVFAKEITPIPPVWTFDQGLSAAFIEKYEITPREREVIEAMLQGKTDKEISLDLGMAVNTVQVHLKRIYRKTGAAGRFALSALIRGG